MSKNNDRFGPKIRKLNAIERRLSIPDKFWARVRKTDSCWLWVSYLSSNGYGRYHIGGRVHQAHRIAYLAIHGSIPDGMVLDHLCRVTRCVNPAHLEPVSFKENILRGFAIKRQKAKTHCPHGHPYTKENTCLSRGKTQFRRSCRECKRLADTKRRVALRQANREGAHASA